MTRKEEGVVGCVEYVQFRTQRKALARFSKHFATAFSSNFLKKG